MFASPGFVGFAALYPPGSAWESRNSGAASQPPSVSEGEMPCGGSVRRKGQRRDRGTLLKMTLKMSRGKKKMSSSVKRKKIKEASSVCTPA